jgi:tetratricopeptide (TPR) repeat protein
MLLALLAAETVAVLPFATTGSAPREAGLAAAESIVDVVVQQNLDNFVTLKQLDAVLRRRDIPVDAPNLYERSGELAKALGATELVLGEVSEEGGKVRVSGKLIAMPGGAVKREAEGQGLKNELPRLLHKLGLDLLQATTRIGPMTTHARALLDAAGCEAALARQSLGAHSKATLKPDQLERAEKLCKAALKDDPKLALAKAGLAVTLAVRGKFGEAKSLAQSAEEGRFVPLAVLAESYADRGLNDAKGWKVALQNSISERPGFLHALGYLAEDAMERGDDKAALELFSQYLERSPNHPWAMSKKARELARNGQQDEAIELSEKALALNPGDPELLIETASRYLDAGRDSRAEPLLRQAMTAAPPRPLAALRLGYLYIRTHKLPQAREALETCLRMATREDEAKTRGIAHADLARVAAKQNRYPDAVTELEAARKEGNERLPCQEPELQRWKDRPELKRVCVEAAAAAADASFEEDATPGDN